MINTRINHVLSLFDGMSCGQIALNRIGIKPTKYYAAEVDKYAIKVTQANYPDTIQMGDVTKWREWNVDWASIDLLIGGSPCQGFSFAGKQLAFDDPRSKLFFVYVDILNHIKAVNPGVKFLLENVRMKKDYLNIISEQLGVEPVFINSALVSAQNRQRYYWANWEITQPEDKGTTLTDILEPTVDVSFLHTDKAIEYMGRVGSTGRVKWSYMFHSEENKGKSQCVTANFFKGVPNNVLVGKCGAIRKFTPIEVERLQTAPDNYTNHVSNSQRFRMLGNGWTVDVIARIFSTMQSAEVLPIQTEQRDLLDVAV